MIERVGFVVWQYEISFALLISELPERPFSPEFGLTSESSGEYMYHSCLGGADSFDSSAARLCRARQ